MLKYEAFFSYFSLFYCILQRLFFLNGEQDLSSFLLADLGLVKYPSYTCNILHHIFPTRSDLLTYEEVSICLLTENVTCGFLFWLAIICTQAIEVAQVLDQSLDENNIDTVISCIEVSHGHISTPRNTMAHSLISESEGTFLSHFSASWVYSKVATLGVSFFERERRYFCVLLLCICKFSNDWVTLLFIDKCPLGEPTTGVKTDTGNPFYSIWNGRYVDSVVKYDTVMFD